jgi:hypothetical protein
VAGIFGRKHEHRLGKVELPCDRLHQPGIEPARSGEDRELITAEHLTGKDVRGIEGNAGGHRGLAMVNGTW